MCEIDWNVHLSIRVYFPFQDDNLEDKTNIYYRCLFTKSRIKKYKL